MIPFIRNTKKDKTLLFEIRLVDTRAQGCEKGMNCKGTQKNWGGVTEIPYIYHDCVVWTTIYNSKLTELYA